MEHVADSRLLKFIENLTREPTHRYNLVSRVQAQIDAHNQLTRSTSFSSATEPKLCTDYLYDAFGGRIAKRVVDEHCHTVIEQTETHGLRQSMSRPGKPIDNAVAESFFKTLKMEVIYPNRHLTKVKMMCCFVG